MMRCTQKSGRMGECAAPKLHAGSRDWLQSGPVLEKLHVHVPEIGSSVPRQLGITPHHRLQPRRPHRRALPHPPPTPTMTWRRRFQLLVPFIQFLDPLFYTYTCPAITVARCTAASRPPRHPPRRLPRPSSGARAPRSPARSCCEGRRAAARHVSRQSLHLR